MTDVLSPMKRCGACGEIKVSTNFYLDRFHSARQSSCKECQKKYQAKRREAGFRAEIEQRAQTKLRKTRPGVKTARNRLYRKKNPEKRRAHLAVKTAIRSGRLKQKLCEICGSNKTQAHHDDYNKPLNVIWLCAQHHKDRHSA